jgi:hypothetical protein
MNPTTTQATTSAIAKSGPALDIPSFINLFPLGDRSSFFFRDQSSGATARQYELSSKENKLIFLQQRQPPLLRR